MSINIPPPLVRSDILPENTAYRDNGCPEAPRCVECPHADCIFEADNALAQLRARDERRGKVGIFKDAGYTVQEIADQVGCSQRTVHRDIEILRRPKRHIEMPGMDDAPPKVAVSDLRPLAKQRDPLPEIRPGVSRTTVIYERG